MLEEVVANKAREAFDRASFEVFSFGTEQESLSEEDQEFLRLIAGSEASQARSTEVEFASQLINIVATNSDIDPETQGEIEDYFESMDVATDVMAKRQAALAVAMDTQQKYDNAGWGKFALDVGRILVPALSWYNISNRVGNIDESILPGNDLDDQVTYLWSLPPVEFAAKLREAVEDIRTKNPVTRNDFDALAFTNAVIAYSDSDRFLDNAFAVAGDLAPFALTKPVRAAGRAASLAAGVRIRNASKGAIRASRPRADKPVDVPDALDHIGQVEIASETAAAERILEAGFDIERVQEVKGLKDLLDALPSITNPAKFLGAGGRSLSVPRRQKILDNVSASIQAVARAIQEPELVSRLSPAVLSNAIENATVAVKRDFSDFNNAVVDVRVPQELSDISNTGTVEILFGRTDGSIYASERGARRMADKFMKIRDDIEVKPHGDGWVISVKKDLNENKAFWDNMTIDTDSQNTINGLRHLAAIMGGNPKDFTSRMQSLARNSVNHGITQFGKLLGEASQQFRSMSRAELKDFEKVLRANMNKVKDGRKGRYLDTLAELEDEFIKHTGVLPSAKQVEAYQTYVLLNDTDYLMRNLTWYKSKVIMGVENVTLETPKLTIRNLEARQIDDLPYDKATKENATVAFIEPDGTVRTRRLSNTRKLPKEIQEAKRNGYAIFQTFDAPVNVATGKRPVYARFLVSRSHIKSRIGVKNVERQEGGHHINRYEHYVKQSNMKGDYYVGDLTFMNAHTAKEANELAETMERVRELWNAGDMSAFKTYFADNVPFMSLRQWEALVKKGKIRTDVPFVGTKAGVRTLDVKAPVDTSRKSLVDTRKSIYNLSGEMNRRFGLERQIGDARILKEESNAAVVIDKAPKLDPLEALDVGLRDVTNQRFLQDYLSLSLNEFFKQFGDVIKDDILEARADPLNTLANVTWREGVNDELLKSAKIGRDSILHFSNHTTAAQRAGTAFQQKMANLVYDRFGERGLNIVNGPALNWVKNPDVALRSIGFHQKLGLFNPVQLFLQAQTITHILSIAPAQGVKGMSAAVFMRRLGLNAQPEVVAKYAQFAGMTADEFMESYNAMRRSGWWEVGRDVNYLDDVYSGNILTTDWHGKSAMFFNEGERLTRLTAWNTAYLEWRTVNKGAKFDRFARQNVLSRADDLSLNMTRASNTFWQKGLLSIPTQFFSYQFRLMEQFLGTGRVMTPATKARALAIYSVVYGLPYGVGVPVAFWPMAESMKRELIERNIEYDDTLFEPIIEGMADTFWEAISGQDMDFSGRLAPSGLEIGRDLLLNDASFFEVIGGAPGSILGEMLSAVPLYKTVMGMTHPHHAETPLSPHTTDWLKPLREISTVDQIIKSGYAIFAGDYLSKRGTLIEGDMHWMEAAVMGLTGASPDRFTDGFLKQDIMQSWRRVKADAKEKARRALRRSAKADSLEDQLMYYREAQAYLEVARKNGMFVREQNAFLRQVAQETIGGRDLLESIHETYERWSGQRELIERVEDLGSNNDG